MSTEKTLPEPASDALSASAALSDTIRARIEAAGGWMDFADYMQAALYEPRLGYYSGGATKFGPAGDFTTAPEISPLFSRCTGRFVDAVLARLGGGQILELGAGTGAMAAELLCCLEQLGRQTDCYAILEVSGELRARQAQTIAARAPNQLERVTWLDKLPQTPFTGVVLANEVVDALPVSRFRCTDAEPQALGVGLQAGELAWQTRSLTPELAACLRELWPDGPQQKAGYTSEVCVHLAPWVASISDVLENGAMLVIDYGLTRRDYYRADRANGTLRCHYRHRAHDDPFFYPGLQDITAWVDFTALAEAAAAAGLTVAGFTTQAQFLLSAGLDADLQNTEGLGTIERIELAQQVRRLVMPGDMGEHFKVMALTREIDLPQTGFSGRDLRHLL